MNLKMLKGPPTQASPMGQIKESPALKAIERSKGKLLYNFVWANEKRADAVAYWMAQLPIAKELKEAVSHGFRVLEIDPYSQTMAISPVILGKELGTFILDADEYERAERDNGWPVITLELAEVVGYVAYNPMPRLGVNGKPVAETGPDKVVEPPDAPKVELEAKDFKNPKIIV